VLQAWPERRDVRLLRVPRLALPELEPEPELEPQMRARHRAHVARWCGQASDPWRTYSRSLASKTRGGLRNMTDTGQPDRQPQTLRCIWGMRCPTTWSSQGLRVGILPPRRPRLRCSRVLRLP